MANTCPTVSMYEFKPSSNVFMCVQVTSGFTSQLSDLHIAHPKHGMTHQMAKNTSANFL